MKDRAEANRVPILLSRAESPRQSQNNSRGSSGNYGYSRPPLNMQQPVVTPRQEDPISAPSTRSAPSGGGYQRGGYRGGGYRGGSSGGGTSRWHRGGTPVAVRAAGHHLPAAAILHPDAAGAANVLHHVSRHTPLTVRRLREEPPVLPEDREWRTESCIRQRRNDIRELCRGMLGGNAQVAEARFQRWSMI